jgi:hypothetical protein
MYRFCVCGVILKNNGMKNNKKDYCRIPVRYCMKSWALGINKVPLELLNHIYICWGRFSAN